MKICQICGKEIGFGEDWREGLEYGTKTIENHEVIYPFTTFTCSKCVDKDKKK